MFNGASAGRDFATGTASINASRASFASDNRLSPTTEENDTPNEGLVSEHFAYWLEGAAFARLQSSTWKEVSGPVTHYQFVTGWACMDVLIKPLLQRSPSCDGSGG